MTHGHSALLAGLDQLRSASPGAVFGELIRAGLQELIEAEATAVIGAARYKRSDGRTVQRNGHRPKQWLVVANGRRKPSARLRPGRDGSRRQAARLPLPPVAPATGWRVSTRLARDHHVRIDSNDYSVCPAVIGRRIELIVNLQGEALCEGRVVADHPRVWAWHQSISDPEYRAAAMVRRRKRAGVLRPLAEIGAHIEVEHRSLSDYDTALGLDLDGGVA